MPSACHVRVEAVHESAPPLYASTGPTVRGITGNKFRREASGAFVQNVKMLDKVACVKDAEVAHHLGSMPTRIKAAMSLNALSTA